MGNRANRWTGWALLAWAATLEHTVAKKATWEQRQARRNKTLRKARDRGVPTGVMARWLGLEENTVRALLAKANKPSDD